MQPVETIIQVRDLVKEYRTGFWLIRKARVLDGVSFEVEANQVFGLLGPNGAGKTTTLKALLGLIRPTSGNCLIFGKPVDRLEVRRLVGFLPENPYYYMYLTGSEFLRFCGDLFGLPRPANRRRSQELLELVGLRDHANKPLRAYSKGMLQRIGIAQALINDPQLVFLDEPMSGLDPIGRLEVRRIMERLKQQGKTVFFNTHILPDVEQVCDRAAIMIKGRIHLAGDLESLTTGGDSCRYRLQVEAVTEEMRGRLDRLAPLEVLPVSAGRWEVLFADEEQALQAAAQVAEWGARVSGVAVYRQTLEDVFMAKVQEVMAGEGLVL